MQTIQLQVAITLDDAAAKTLAELLGPPLRQAAASPASDLDAKREARRRAWEKAMFGGQKPPEDQELLIDSKQASKLLDVSPRKLWAMQHNGEIPPPIKIGRAVRWSVDALRKWIDDGCPALIGEVVPKEIAKVRHYR